MQLDQALVEAAIDQMRRRWPSGEQVGAAAVYLASGQILTSVCLPNMHGGASLCHEAGAYCQAYTMNQRITASACVSWEPDSQRILILAPCGICQERLALWGPTVEVAVPAADDPTAWETRTLADVNPYFWARAYAAGVWPSQEMHEGR